MINSQEKAESVGYKSPELTYEKNGHYRISINVLTDNVTAGSSLYLFNGNEVFAEITNINTRGKWARYFFYFTTNNYEELKLNIGLWKGSKEFPAKSYVLFDSVKSNQITKSALDSALENTGIDGKTVFSNNGNVYYKNLAGDNIIETVSMDERPIYATGQGSYVYDNAAELAFRVKNNNESYNSFAMPEFEMIPNKVYQFSIKAKVVNIDSGSAYIKLVEKVDDGEEAIDGSTLTFSSTSNKYTNGYVEYSIVANSDSLKERTVKLVLGLGTASSSTAKGEVLFKDYTISSVPYSETDNSTTKFVNLSAEGTSTGIDNGRFDKSEATKISTKNEIGINAPSKWTVNAKNSGQTAGVFNIKYADKLDTTGLTNFVNPGINPAVYNDSNNVLMLHNEVADVLDCYSSKFSLTKESYYKISVFVKTMIVNDHDSVATIKVLNQDKDDMPIATINNVSTNGEWKEYTILVRTGFETFDACLVLSLGNEKVKASGYVYFDQCKLKTDDTVKALYEDFDNRTYENTFRFDLQKPFSLTDEKGSPIYFASNSNYNLDSSVGKIVNLTETEVLRNYLNNEEISALQKHYPETCHRLWWHAKW